MPTFTIMGSGIGYIGGNYKNDQPGQAAKKAGKALFKKLTLSKYAKYKNKTSIKFVLRMRDRHTAGKTYAYMVTREKLPKPLLMKKGNVEYEIKYKYNIESCNLTSAEVKTMTGGALAMVGGKLTYTGKEMKGGNTEEEGQISNQEYDNTEDHQDPQDPQYPQDTQDPENIEEDTLKNPQDDSNTLRTEEDGERVGGKAKSSKASSKAKTAKVSKDVKGLNKAKAKSKK